MKKQTEIYSIFGQIEAAAAEMMIERKLAKRIDARDIPPTALHNEKGETAKFAVIIASANQHAFEELIRDLRA
jgi:hypothetical protein